MIRTVWGNDERYKTHYWPEELGGKLYQAGDGAIRDPETGYFTITGRIDDVLNVSGHVLGTMEVESVLVAHPMVAEAAVVGKPDDLTGGIHLCVCHIEKRVAARRSGENNRFRFAKMGIERNQPDCAAQENPIRRESAESTFLQDHAPPVTCHC